MKDEKFKVLLYLKKSTTDKKGKAPIMGRITLGNSMSQFSCKISCTPDLWNPRESRLNGKSKEAVEVNRKIEQLLLSISNAYESVKARQPDFCAADVKAVLQGSIQSQVTLMQYAQRMKDECHSRIGVDRAKGTYYHYKAFCDYLQAFILKKFKTEDIAFGQLTEQFIYDFQSYICDECGHEGSARHFLALLKKACKGAFKEGIAERQYFAHFSLPRRRETTPKALSRETFEKIRDLHIDPKHEGHILSRDMFLFACYTGVPYSDVVSVTDDNLSIDEDGNLWLKYLRRKNENRAAVKLLPEAIALIEKYHDDTRKTLFPYVFHRTLHAHLRGISGWIGLKDPIHFHQGRHSFASLITLEEGVPLETISRMLGHTNINQTQVYARVTPKKLFEDMDKFIEATKDFNFITKIRRNDYEKYIQPTVLHQPCQGEDRRHHSRHVPNHH